MNKQLKERWVSNFRDLRRPDGAPKDKRLFNLADGSTTQLFLYDEIGYFGITADDFSRDIRAIGTPQIELHINSPGGDVFDGLAILNTLRQHNAKITTVVDGLAASAASFIAMAGEEVLMAPNSQLMIHDAFGICMGNAADMRQLADLLDKQSDNIADIYAAKAGGTVADWRAVMKEEGWYGAQEAVDAGLADALVSEGDQPQNKRSALDLMDRLPISNSKDNSKSPDFDWDPEMFRRAFEEAVA